MASKSLTYNIFGKDRSASKAMDSVATRATRAAKRVAVAAAAIAAAIALVVVRFGVESVKAAADAETQQNKLVAAWAKFPKTADLSITALREYNSELQKTTRFDDDQIAASQAVLAQFKLTGKQIQKITPLVLDYAAKTGKDLPAAATIVGKALLGNAKALKAIGIDFKSTGDAGKDFEGIMAALTAQVGGFAEKEGTTAAGKLAILQNRFGEIQETVGAALLPVLMSLADTFEQEVMPWLEDFAAWFAEDGIKGIQGFIGFLVEFKDDIIPGIVVALGGWTSAQLLLNAAMYANPVGAVIGGIVALITILAALMTNLGGSRTKLLQFWKSFAFGILDIAGFIASSTQNVINGVIRGIQFLLAPLNQLRALLGMPVIQLPTVRFGNSIASGISMMKLNYQAAGGSAAGFGGSAGGSGSGVRLPTMLAEGGIVTSPTLAMIGEGGESEAVIPLSKLNQGGDTYVFRIGTLIGDDNRAIQKLARKVVQAKDRGAVSQGAFA